MRFTAKEGDGDQDCFVFEEENEVTFRLPQGADLAKAQEVAKFLNENIRDMEWEEGIGGIMYQG